MVKLITQTTQHEQTNYNWGVKLDDSLRKPVARLALEKEKEIREIVSDAVRSYLNLPKGEN